MQGYKATSAPKIHVWDDGSLSFANKISAEIDTACDYGWAKMGTSKSDNPLDRFDLEAESVQKLRFIISLIHFKKWWGVSQKCNGIK